jgi:hypothetical protein
MRTKECIAWQVQLRSFTPAVARVNAQSCHMLLHACSVYIAPIYASYAHCGMMAAASLPSYVRPRPSR